MNSVNGGKYEVGSSGTDITEIQYKRIRNDLTLVRIEPGRLSFSFRSGTSSRVFLHHLLDSWEEPESQ